MRRASRLLVAAAATAAVAAAAQAATVDLPTGIDGRQSRLLIAALDAGQFGPVENHAPSTVTVHEAVRVEIAPDGTVGPVRERQTLDLAGVGDYVLEMPSGAVEVAPAPGTDNSPGLRQGTVLWEGFSGGDEHLAADVTLGPDLADRFPLAVTGDAAAGTVTLRLANTTGLPMAHELAVPAAAPLRDALAAARRQLGASGRLEPGTGDLPSSLPVTTEPAGAATEVGVQVRVTGTISFAGEPRQVDLLLPPDPDTSAELSGPAPVVPDLAVELLPPGPQAVPDPAGVTDGDGAAADARRDALGGLITAIGASLRHDDYLPLIPGFVDTAPSVSFSIVAAAEAAPSPIPSAPAEPPGSARPLALLAAGLLALSAGALWWQS